MVLYYIDTSKNANNDFQNVHNLINIIITEKYNIVSNPTKSTMWWEDIYIWSSQFEK